MPLPLTIGTGRALLGGADRLAAFRAMLQAQATFALWGPDATLSSWPDVVAGVNAAPGGSGTTLGTLNGVACPTFNGSGWYQTGALTAVAQPFACVTIQSPTDVSTRQIVDGRTLGARAGLRVTGNYWMFAGTVVTAGTSPASPQVFLGTFNGASSTLQANGTQVLAGNIGTQGPTGYTIGAAYDTTTARFVGPIALVAIFDSTKLANAAAVAAAARSLIGV